jgi:hypothetical protein
MSAKKKLSKQQIIDILDQQVDHLLSVISEDSCAENAHDLAAIIKRLKFIMREMQ